MGLEIDLEGRTAIITGGGRGIGRSIASVFAEAGANVAVAARTEREIDEVADQARSYDVDAVAIPTDLSKLDEIDHLVTETEHRLGQPDVLINNAGVNPRGSMFERSESEVDTTLAVNMRGVFFLSQRFAESYTSANIDHAGRIINISSVYAYLGVPSRTVYGATKAGINGLTRGLAVELAQDGITVNSISPGRVSVKRIEELGDTNDEDGSMDVDRIPLGRLGATEEVAYLSAFLASGLAEYITGEDFRVDGGVSITAAPYPIRRPTEP